MEAADYMNYWHSCREATLEISADKTPQPASCEFGIQLPVILNYIDQVRYGFSGVVTDTVTGEPVAAQVFIFGHDVDNSQVYSTLPPDFTAAYRRRELFRLLLCFRVLFQKALKTLMLRNGIMCPSTFSFDLSLRYK